MPRRRERKIRACQVCGENQANVWFRKQWICRRCLYPNAMDGYRKTFDVVVGGQGDYHPHSDMPAPVGASSHLLDALNKALDRHNIPCDFSFHDSIS